MTVVQAVQRHAKALTTLDRAERRLRDAKTVWERVSRKNPEAYYEPPTYQERTDAYVELMAAHTAARRARTRQRNLNSAMRSPWEV